MPLPDSFRVESENPPVYEIQSAKNGVVSKVEPTISPDGNRLIIIKGSGIGTWGIGDGEFPKREMFGSMNGTATAIAVLNDRNEHVATAYGRGDSSQVTIDRVKYNDGTVGKLDERLTIEFTNLGKNTKVKLDDAKILSAMVSNNAPMDEKGMEMARAVKEAVIGGGNKYQSADVPENVSPGATPPARRHTADVLHK